MFIAIYSYYTTRVCLFYFEKVLLIESGARRNSTWEMCDWICEENKSFVNISRENLIKFLLTYPLLNSFFNKEKSFSVKVFYLDFV